VSNLEVEAARQAMEESGEMDFIRAHAAAADGTPTPAPEADTVETEQEPVEQTEEETTDGKIPAGEPEDDQEDAAAEQEDIPLTPEEEDVLYLDLDPETQSLIDTKYGGDMNKALAALKDSQSLIGRQGSELGDLRKQLEDLTTLVQQGQIRSQPYPEWPDEFAEPHESAAAFRAIAEEAFTREDADTFATAVNAWAAQDPAAAGTYRDLKVLQLTQAMAAQPQAPDATSVEATLQAGIAELQQKYPRFTPDDPEFMGAFDAELEKLPTLRSLLWGEIPGTTPAERLAALDETVGRVASRFTADTERAARRRIAIRTSEEAAQARREARVTSGETARVVEEEPAPRTVPLGQTGRTLDLDRLNAMLPPEDRLS
jgi:hypothetical protein